MKLNNTYVIKEILDFYIALSVSNDPQESISTINLGNETTKRIFELIQEGKEDELIIKIMLEEYDVEENVLKSEVSNFISKLKAEGIIVD